ncbi:MAG: oxygen-independent coproporphyrinogen III oxidase [Gammaproteobacteria bacterium]|nr:oxygen-independent coproporphyrinogen III oxidase [Gammaproteobacteria bacterium]
MIETASSSTANSDVIFDEDLIRRYDIAGPRYTSYPTAPQFHENYNERCYRDNVHDSNGDLIPRPLSLYFHLPFCAHVCFYCACTKIITANRSRADAYVDYLVRELHMHAKLFDEDRHVSQIHWGGGTPTYLRPESITRLMTETRRSFRMEGDDTGEYSIEIDPREASAETISLLRRLGFNRLSVGIQDFDPLVQTAVNRLQSYEDTAAVIHAARDWGFRSVSVDLIYGLPHQSVAGFSRTLDRTLELEPDRIAAFNYAHLPHRFKSQRRIDDSKLPTAEQKLALFGQTVEQLTAAGYVYIGMDHFARPDDELAVAQREGLLHRNFQGYTTHGDCDLVGIGMSSIGIMGDSYHQNVRDLEEYYRRIDAGRIPIFRGFQLCPEDLLRRDIIMSLMCNFRVEFDHLERKYGFRFTDFFATELQKLDDMQEDGLLQINENGIIINPLGRLMVRNICMVFDTYLEQNQNTVFSRTI